MRDRSAAKERRKDRPSEQHPIGVAVRRAFFPAARESRAGVYCSRVKIDGAVIGPRGRSRAERAAPHAMRSRRRREKAAEPRPDSGAARLDKLVIPAPRPRRLDYGRGVLFRGKAADCRDDRFSLPRSLSCRCLPLGHAGDGIFAFAFLAAPRVTVGVRERSGPEISCNGGSKS